MKIDLSLLEKFVDLPTRNPEELRVLFDDIGLEVKDIDLSNAHPVFTIETLANRGDHLYALGIAREISARTLARVHLPSIAQSLSDRKPAVAARIETDLCRRYCLLEMTLPAAMSLRNDVAQIIYPDGEKNVARPAIVDLLNYVQKELGVPMHAFDRDKIDGEISIEAAKQEGIIEALDGKPYTYPVGTILICDRKKVLAAGGIIGCANSMVTLSTQRTLIEAAWFDPIQIRKSARRMGLSTDASYAFERGTDLEMISVALKRLVYLCGDANGAAAAHVVGYSNAGLERAQSRNISFALSMLRHELNSPRLPGAEVSARLKQLGFGVSEKPSDKDVNFEISVPAWRLFDISDPEDMLEEFSRAHGLSQVRIEMPPLDYDAPALNEIEIITERLEVALLGNGFFEVITRNFCSAAEVEILAKRGGTPLSQHVALKNSIESNNAYLKTTNILSLARVAQENLRKGVTSIKVFEYGRFYTLKDGQEVERDFLTLGFSGRWFEGEFRRLPGIEERAKLFRGIVDAIGASVGCNLHFSDEASTLLHPGVRAGIKLGRSVCGSFGLIDPRLERELDLQTQLFYAEFDLAALAGAIKHGSYAEVSEFPSIKRDVTFKLGLRENSSKLVAKVEAATSSLVDTVQIVDDFRKESEEFRRLTLRLVFRDKSRTLQSQEVDNDLGNLLSTLRERGNIEQILT